MHENAIPHPNNGINARGKSLDVRRLFLPDAVAVVGASSNLESIGGQPIKYLMKHGYPGKIYPVNPKYDDIAGLRCFPDIGSLPEVPDVLVVAVAAGMVTDIIKKAGQKKIPFAIIFSSGFAETGNDGQAVQKKLAEIARSTGICIIGPNCQGLMNIAEGQNIGFGAPYALKYSPGRVSMTSQSGAFGNSLLMGLDDEGIGFRHYISTGNEAMTTSLDFFNSFLDDDQTGVVAGYVEGFQDAYRLRDIGRKALQKDIPLVLWKVGNTSVGAKAAASHTANMAGKSTYYQTAFKQYGIVGAEDVGDMADCIRAFLPGRRPQGNRVGVVTISGGAGIAMADRCIELGLEVPAFSQETLEQLRPVLPAFASFANPLDITAGVLKAPESFNAALRAIADSPKVDMLGLCMAALSGPGGIMAAGEIAQLASELDIPIVVAWNALPETAEKAYPILEEAGVPVYQTPVRCARGLGALWEYSSAVQRFQKTGQIKSTTIHRRNGQSPKITGEGLLNEYESKQVFRSYGLPVTQEDVAQSAEEAVKLSRDMGFPVVLKILSADVAHKSDLGGVITGLQNEEAVREAYAKMMDNPERFGKNVLIDGVLVQEMVSVGTEVILGAVYDANFGPLIMFGAGGIFAEVFKDVAFRLAPLNHQDAEELVAETKISRILSGVRGIPEADKDALIDCILRLSDLIVDQAGRVTEIDVNPLFVMPKGQGAKVGDALVKVTQSQLPIK